MFQKLYLSLNSLGEQCCSCSIGSGSLGVCKVLHQHSVLQSGTNPANTVKKRLCAYAG